jgi:hypothetical protein
MRNDQKTARMAGLAGLAGISLGVIGFFVDQMWQFPATNSSTEEIVAFVREHRTPLLVAMLVNTAAVALWLAFGAGVWLGMRDETGAETYLSACFALGMVSLVTLLLGGFTPFLVLVYRTPDATEARLLYDVTFGLLAMSGAPTVLALGSYAAFVRRSGALPRSTGGLAALAVVAHVALFSSFVVRTGFFSLEGPVIIAIPATLFVWIGATSIAMLRTT